MLAKAKTRVRKIKRKSILYPTPKEVVILVTAFVIVYCLYSFSKYLLNKTTLFQTANVVVSGNSYLNTQEIRSAASIDLKQTVFQINKAAITKNLLENKYVRGVSVSRILPSTILIDIQEREPILYLIDKSIYMVDETGMILKILPGMPVGKLPIVTGFSVKKLEKDRTALFEVIHLIRQIQEVDAALFAIISEIHIDKKQQPELFLVKGGTLVKLGDTQYYQRIFLLSQFLSRELIIKDLSEIKRIDLRFKNRIIVQKRIRKSG